MWWIIAGLVFVAFFAAGCACCGCPLFSDTFVRSDSTDLGSSWTEVSGDWSISSNMLTTSSTNALVIASQDVGPESGIVSVTLNSKVATRRIAKIIGAYVDSDNYIFGELDFTRDPTTWDVTEKIRLYERVSGSNTLIAEMDRQFQDHLFGESAASLNLKLCWNGVTADFKVGYGGDANLWSLHEACTLTGSKGGVGTGSEASNLEFFNFKVEGNKHSNSQCVGCYGCLDGCSDGLPDTIEVTFPSTITDGTCTLCESEISGQTVVLDKLDNRYDEMLPYTVTGNSPYSLVGTPTMTPNDFKARSCSYRYNPPGECTTASHTYVSAVAAWFVFNSSAIPTPTVTIYARFAIHSTPAFSDGQIVCSYVTFSKTMDAPISCSGNTFELDYLNAASVTGSDACCLLDVGSPGVVEVVT